MQAHAAGARVPLRSRRLLPEPLVQLPVEAAVSALEENAGISARIEEAVFLSRSHRPEAD